MRHCRPSCLACRPPPLLMRNMKLFPLTGCKVAAAFFFSQHAFFKLNLQPEAALCRIDHPATFLHFFPSSSDVIFSSFSLFSFFRFKILLFTLHLVLLLAQTFLIRVIIIFTYNRNRSPSQFSLQFRQRKFSEQTTCTETGQFVSL